MTFDEIRLFISTAKHLSVTKAAHETHINQSAASRKLQQLQKELDTALLRKTGRGVELTQSGKVFFEEAVSIVSRVDAFKQSYGSKRTECLTLAGTHGASTHLLPSLLSQFNRIYPTATLNLQVGTSATVEEWILAAEADLGVIAMPTVSPSLHMEPYRTEKPLAFVAQDHWLARRKSIHASEFSEIQLIIRNRRRGQSRIEIQLRDCTKQGMKFKSVMRCHSSESVKAAVREGTGVGILFRDTIKQEIDQGKFVAIQFPGLDAIRQTYVAYSKKRPLSSLAQEFLSLLRDSATKDVSGVTLNTPVSNERRKTRLPDYVLRSALLSWITSAASLDWITVVLA